ncbi:MAG: AAA family ATPase [Verrucomicrobiota bacterium JB025]|nr:AAA family ATPase [Verrucomicrobiota bacterium JB025]
MTTNPQAEVVAFLKDPATHDTSDAVEVVETHAAHVFLAGGDAYKIKRAVRYDYLDYSMLPMRRAALERELELNGRAAPGIYRDVVAITRDGDGRLRIGGAGEPVEWVLRMARFRAEDELANVAERGALDVAMAETLGESVARYHAMAAVRRGKPGSVLIGQILDELEREFAGLSAELPADDTNGFLGAARARLARDAGLLDARTAAGRVRRCHGDLHLRNFVLIDGAPVPFDALEFDEELGTCDVLYDLAFLLMDLRHRGLGGAANAALNAYLRTTDREAELAGLRVLPMFIGVRAAISAMVAVQTARARGSDAGKLADGRQFLADARAALAPVAPALVAIGGMSGAGKTTLARALAPDAGAVPGAVHLRSDVERKAMLGVAPTARLPDAAYAPEVSARVYERLVKFAGIALRAGHAVVADAVYLRPEDRRAIAEVARACDAGFSGLWLDAGEDVLVARVDARRGDASDADARVVRLQRDHAPDRLDWQRIDASGPVSRTIGLARAALPRRA